MCFCCASFILKPSTQLLMAYGCSPLTSPSAPCLWRLKKVGFFSFVLIHRRVLGAGCVTLRFYDRVFSPGGRNQRRVPSIPCVSCSCSSSCTSTVWPLLGGRSQALYQQLMILDCFSSSANSRSSLASFTGNFLDISSALCELNVRAVASAHRIWASCSSGLLHSQETGRP